MEKFEILSPVGDKETFYKAIKSGADAVYLGLPKFNARMRADNIAEENLKELVDYAHLKGVKVYVTMNTLLKTDEVVQAVDLAGRCLLCGVDAFIVQDLGLITALKSVYPDVELHGSTQMGVHNVRGARMAKKLGLSRVVLSREVTLDDIREIKDNVDIELEVFIQGALCVAFSGNCYISSLKHNASGNRGECKQLCRLPYTLACEHKKKEGYAISPRDICNIDYLKELMDIGVKSFKIEGRLRHSGYVAVATSVYRRAIDDILNINKEALKVELKKVFNRGDYIPGYFDGNDIINTQCNNHLGTHIGKVVACDKFKDIYRITISSSKQINSGDGIKFVCNSEIVSMGVGNVECINKNIQVFGKNYVKIGSSVYLSLDSEFENGVADYSKKIKLDWDLDLREGKPARVRVQTNTGIMLEKYGDVCEKAKVKAMDKETIITQLGKCDRDVFEMGDVRIGMDNIYMSVSQINSIRREIINEIISKSTQVKNYEKNTMMTINQLDNPTFTKLAIINEKIDVSRYKDYDALILSPEIYSKEKINKFIERYAKYYSSPLIINLPIIAMKKDLEIIDDIIDSIRDKNVILLANNIYALDYLDRCNVWAGSNMNIANDYTASALKAIGIKEMISSIEKWCPTISNTYKVTRGNMVLMTLSHCPYKTLYSNDCSNCKFEGGLSLTSNKNEYKIRRYKISNCYYELVDNVNINYKYFNVIEDMR